MVMVRAGANRYRHTSHPTVNSLAMACNPVYDLMAHTQDQHKKTWDSLFSVNCVQSGSSIFSSLKRMIYM